MEFSSRKTKSQPTAASIRHNPYASGGKNFLSKFHTHNDRSSSLHATPPRKNFNRFRKSDENSNVKSSRARNILQNSQLQNSSKENNIKFSSSFNGNSPHSKPNKRTFKSLNTENDPFSVFSDDDEDELLSNKYTKINSDVDKENNNSNKKTVKVHPRTYSPSSVKRKPISLFRSKIAHDVSPEKVTQFAEADSSFTSEKKIFKFKSFGKENGAEEITESATGEELIPHMIGFPNFGNTCYLNAVLQTLVSFPSFITDLSSSVHTVNMTETSLCHSLWNVIVARQKTDLFSIKNALRTMKDNVEKIDDSFSGYKMQDANEFLTQVLDTIKDEVNNGGCLMQNEDNVNCSTCTPEKLPDLLDPSSFQPSSDLNVAQHYKKSIFSTPSSSSSSNFGSQDLKLSLEEGIDLSRPSLAQNTTPVKCVLPLTDNNRNEIKDGKENFVNPVANNFEFELFESYRCLGCGETEGKRQKHFVLYVDLPSEDNKSIQEAVESYMSEDQRELTCEKCEHKKASFLTSFTELPRILIVQMKRYKYNTENLELMKVQSKVDVNLWLRLDKLASDNIASPPEFIRKPVRFQKRDAKVTTLSVRNLSSELNICSSVTPIKNEEGENAKEKEDQVFEETLKKSLEEVCVEGEEKVEKSDHEKEEEELQTAIKLSLQDLGMSFATQDNINENHNQNLEVSEEESGDDDEHSYRLISVISHFGLTTTTGHYVSDIMKCDVAKWYHYDDELVSSLSESVIGGEGRQKNGYIFFYIHRDVYNSIRTPKT